MTVENRFYKIAIDGYSSCGKSTLARDLAKAIDFVHIDTGAMYRAVTLYLIENDIVPASIDQIDKVIESLDIDFRTIGNKLIVHLNGIPVEPEIRQQNVSNLVSQVSTIKSVRSHLVNLQRKISKTMPVIMEGRDIGTVVFPDADVKLFVTANIEARVNRRYTELQNKGIEISKEEVQKNLEMRDRIDSTREIAPLRQAEDAIVIDNSNMDRKEQLTYVLGIVQSHFDSTSI